MPRVTSVGTAHSGPLSAVMIVAAAFIWPLPRRLLDVKKVRLGLGSDGLGFIQKSGTLAKKKEWFEWSSMKLQTWRTQVQDPYKFYKVIILIDITRDVGKRHRTSFEPRYETYKLFRNWDLGPIKSKHVQGPKKKNSIKRRPRKPKWRLESTKA